MVILYYISFQCVLLQNGSLLSRDKNRPILLFRLSRTFLYRAAKHHVSYSISHHMDLAIFKMTVYDRVNNYVRV